LLGEDICSTEFWAFQTACTDGRVDAEEQALQRYWVQYDRCQQDRSRRKSDSCRSYLYQPAVKFAQLLYENPNPSMHAMAPPKTPTFFGYALLFLFAAAAVAPASTAARSESETCVPSLQRMLSCLDFIEHRSDEIPAPCCVQVQAAVAEQPCCMMHVVRGNAGKLIGPEYDNHRAMVDVTAKCFGDASVLLDVIRNCSGFHR
jgi:hypothetical protein